ncbi:MAG: prolyl-tRNA synthetase associated domain-containing protein [Hyphomicrobiaceae bacterium]|nr:prolyl-tRNA synthetase associated domain-containing protein [Hyphomicrobiaceae bacterium]
MSTPLDRAGLLAYLAELGIAVTTHEHPPVFTVAESRDVKAAIAGGHTKNLFLKDKKDNVFLVVAEGDAAIDLKKIHERIGANGRVTFGKPELMWELLGVIPGSVTPFGVVNDRQRVITVVLDAEMMRHDVLNYHPLENNATTSIARADLIRFLEATGHPPKIIAVSDGKIVEAATADG